ncbi:hypothetical protein GCM10009731_06780 [Streptomyces globosus]
MWCSLVAAHTRWVVGPLDAAARFLREGAPLKLPVTSEPWASGARTTFRHSLAEGTGPTRALSLAHKIRHAHFTHGSNAPAGSDGTIVGADGAAAATTVLRRQEDSTSQRLDLTTRQ